MNLGTSPLRVARVALHFRRDKLPTARSFYEFELGKLTRPNHKGWALGRCPFHQSQSGKSFSVNLDSGAFHCFGCNVHGGDLVSFLRLRDGLSFKQACQQLGAWDEACQPVQVRRVPLVRYLVFEFIIDGTRYSVAMEDEPRNYAALVRNFYREAGEQLTALGLDKSEGDEGKTYWARLALGMDELREMEIL